LILIINVALSDDFTIGIFDTLLTLNAKFSPIDYCLDFINGKGRHHHLLYSSPAFLIDHSLLSPMIPRLSIEDEPQER